MSSNKPLFINSNIVFDNFCNKLSIDDIEESISQDFLGKKEFIKFYMHTNGGTFPNGAYLYSDVFYQGFRKEYLPLEVNSFLHIDIIKNSEEYQYTTSISKVIERREMLSEEFEEFCLFHIPFADNFGDNDFWIDIQTGEIKYVDYEEGYNPDNAIVVAPSFVEFCRHLQAKRRAIK